MDYVTNHWGASHWLIKDLPPKIGFIGLKVNPMVFKRSNYKTTTQFDTNASDIDKN